MTKENRRPYGAFRCMLLAVIIVSFTAFADEGMWTFDNPPLKQLKEKYNFVPTKEWLDHVRLSSVRFNDGGSGSFVSPYGLVVTNHHVALGQLQKISTKDKNYVADGFFARTRSEELKCPDLELNVLISMENVTARVQAAIKPGMTPKEIFDAQRAEIARITKESTDKTGLRSDVISLYNGSEHWLYRYKRYTDVRLVMAPEQQIAFFGGDADNFTYPRYDLDMAFFRVYENGEPIKSDNYLRWNIKGADDGDLVFVSGNPGSTDRLETFSQLEYLRDFIYPLRLKMFHRRLATLQKYSETSPEAERRALTQIFGISNTLKAMEGEYKGLLDPNLMAMKKQQDDNLHSQVNDNPEWKKMYGDAWDSINASIVRARTKLKEFTFRGLHGMRGGPASIAIEIVQYVSEIKKPDTERFPEFRDANLTSLRYRLFSRAPVYTDLEETLLADGLKESLEELGPDDPFLQAVLEGRTPDEAARQLVSGTKLADPEVRKALVNGGETAVQQSTDSLIVLARRIVPMINEQRKWMETNISSVQNDALEKIGRARFAVYGKTTYPDATFTLRLSYGTVKGYPMNGTKAPAKTTLYGLYDRAYSFNNEGDFALPKRYIERVDSLDLSTPINFVSSCDIIGGNSGSPVINRAGEFVGLIFDGDIESLPGRFLFDEEYNRAVAVHPAAMIECLKKIYDAGSLADELEGQIPPWVKQ
jgi:Peptidase S46